MFSARTAWDRTPNLLGARLEMLRARGAELIDLTLSNPADAGLAHDEAWLRAVLGPPLGAYAPEPLGRPSARRAVAAELAQQGAHVSPEHVVLGPSTSDAYVRLFELLCDPGDSVLVPAPSYPLLPYLAELACAELRPYALPDEPGLLLDLDALQAVADDSTRAVVVVSPANPTGWILSPEEQARLDALCARYDWALVVDEVFVGFPGRGRRPTTALARASEALTFSLQGLSKSAGLPGWKLAWTAVAGPGAERTEALARLELVADAHLAVNEPVQRALPSVLAAAPAWRSRVATRLGQNRRALLDARPADAAWDVLPNDAGWSAVLRLPHTTDELDVALRLLDAGVHVQPGHFYDFPRGRFLVLSLLPAPADFARGVERLVSTLARAL